MTTAKPEPSSYPEHEKIRALKGKNEVVGDFVDWLAAQKIHLCVLREARWEDVPCEVCGTTERKLIGCATPGCKGFGMNRIGEPEGYHVLVEPIEKLLARYFDIDLQTLDNEKRAMLEALKASS
jgi:hypothetical protein